MFNSVTISGNLAKDPVNKKVGNSDLTTFRICSDSSKETIYINCDWWDPNENVTPHLVKGKNVIVVGTLIPNSYIRKDGTKVEGFSIKAYNVKLNGTKSKQKEDNELVTTTTDEYEDLPF